MRSTSTTKKLLIALLALVSLGGASVAAIAATSGGDNGMRPAQPEPAVESADAAASASLKFLTQPRSDSDQIPKQTAESVKSQIPYGANLDLSKRVASGDGAVVYAVPGRDFVCTVVPNAEGATTGCSPTKAIIEGTRTGPALIHSASTDAVYATVPDGVSEVTLSLASGKQLDVSVQDGGYYVEVPSSDAPTTVAYDGPNGTVTQQVPVPPKF